MSVRARTCLWQLTVSVSVNASAAVAGTLLLMIEWGLEEVGGKGNSVVLSVASLLLIALLLFVAALVTISLITVLMRGGTESQMQVWACR